MLELCFLSYRAVIKSKPSELFNLSSPKHKSSAPLRFRQGVAGGNYRIAQYQPPFIYCDNPGGTTSPGRVGCLWQEVRPGRGPGCYGLAARLGLKSRRVDAVESGGAAIVSSKNWVGLSSRTGTSDASPNTCARWGYISTGCSQIV